MPQAENVEWMAFFGGFWQTREPQALESTDRKQIFLSN
jgi:hypothetical protein